MVKTLVFDQSSSKREIKHNIWACSLLLSDCSFIIAAERSEGSHLFLTTFTVFTRARSPRDLCILAKANLNLFVGHSGRIF
jgi:hypothetical protein